MSGGTTTNLNPASEPPDVHHTDSAEPHQNKQPVKDKWAYGQVYLARARIEGIEKWRAAVDAALQGAEEDCHDDPEQRGTNLNMNRRRSEEAMQQKEKTEAAEDVQVVQGPNDTAEGTKQKRRRRHELWKGLRSVFFSF